MINRLMVFAIVVFGAFPALSQSTVVCESINDRYKECDISGAGRVVLSREISDRECVEGESWGTRDGVVWVNKGCRAEFALNDRGYINRRSVQSGSGVIICESDDGRRTRCAADTREGVTLRRQISESSTCIQGKTWGYSTTAIWVDQGCRAEFVLGNSRRGDRLRRIQRKDLGEQLLICESQDGKRRTCAVDTREGVRLVRRISDTSCDYGRDWGYDSRGIWVTNGCRAEFGITNVDPGSSGVYSGALETNAAPTRLVCESKNNARSRCRTDTTYGVQLYRQISDKNCVYGKTWGYDNDGVWVSGGCRAEFTVSRPADSLSPYPGPLSSGRAQTVVCESKNNGRTRCAADTRLGVQLSRQLSQNACAFRSDWGFDENGIWVDHGCRAEFVLDGGR